LALWHAVLEHGTTFAGYSWIQLRTFLVLGFLANSLGNGGAADLQWRIQSGNVVSDLMRPLDFQVARLAECLGTLAVELATALFVVAVSILVFGSLELPDNARTWVLYAVSLASAATIKFSLVYATNLTAFWLTSLRGVVFARLAVANVLSGALVPLTFFPHWLKILAFALPFQGIVFSPTLIFLERVSWRDGIGLIALQLGWTSVMWLGGRRMWGWASRALTIQGG
jgi:ABC-2 type transport system permease protein